MDSFSQLSAEALSSISLFVLKSIMSALLSYPYNLAIITLVSIVVAVQFIRGVFRSGNVKRDAKRMKGEIDEGKVKLGVHEIKTDINGVHQEIQKLGLMFGNHAQSESPKLNNNSRGSFGVSEFVGKEQRKTDLVNSRLEEVERSFETVKNEFSAIIR